MTLPTIDLKEEAEDNLLKVAIVALAGGMVMVLVYFDLYLAVRVLLSLVSIDVRKVPIGEINGGSIDRTNRISLMPVA